MVGRGGPPFGGRYPYDLAFWRVFGHVRFRALSKNDLAFSLLSLAPEILFLILGSCHGLR